MLIRNLFSFWYLESAARFYGWLAGTIETLEETIAVRAMIKNIRQPLFQDYSRDGRIVGILMRLGRILAGSFCYALVSVLYLFAWLAWLAFPLLCLVSLLGSIAAPDLS